MYCERCRTPGANGNEGQRSRRPARASRCARCGTWLSTPLDTPSEAKADTHVHLAQFGLAITGDPLLELKRRGV